MDNLEPLGESSELKLRTYDAETKWWHERTVLILLYWVGCLIMVASLVLDPILVRGVLRAFISLGLMTFSIPAIDYATQQYDRQVTGRIKEERIVDAISAAFPEAKIDHRVQIGETNDLDIFVRFPQTKAMFAFSVKGLQQGKIIYNEKAGLICHRRPGQGLSKKDNPDPIAEILDSEWWLRRNNRGIFGGSSRDAKRPVRKALVFPAPITVGEHNPHLYATIGDQQFVCVERGKSSIFLLQEDQVIQFIRSNLLADEQASIKKPR